MIPTIHATHVPHKIASSIAERFERAVCRTHDPYDILKAYENKGTDVEAHAKWETIVALGKMKLTGHFTAKEIHDARFEVR